VCAWHGAGGGFDEGRAERGRGADSESATLEARGGAGGAAHSGTAAARSMDVVASSAAVTVPFASSEDDRNLQTVGILPPPVSVRVYVVSYSQYRPISILNLTKVYPPAYNSASLSFGSFLGEFSYSTDVGELNKRVTVAVTEEKIAKS